MTNLKPSAPARRPSGALSSCAARTRRAVEVGDDATLELEGGIGRIVGRSLVALAVLVDALGDMVRPEAGDGAHVAEGVVEHVAPVAEHVEDHAAAVLGAIVPRRALG